MNDLPLHAAFIPAFSCHTPDVSTDAKSAIYGPNAISEKRDAGLRREISEVEKGKITKQTEPKRRRTARRSSEF
jgi:hypothetical protein